MKRNKFKVELDLYYVDTYSSTKFLFIILKDNAEKIRKLNFSKGQ